MNSNYNKGNFKKCTCECTCGARNAQQKKTSSRDSKQFKDWSLEEKQAWAKSKGFEWKEAAKRPEEKHKFAKKSAKDDAFANAIFNIHSASFKDLDSDDE